MVTTHSNIKCSKSKKDTNDDNKVDQHHQSEPTCINDKLEYGNLSRKMKNNSIIQSTSPPSLNSSKNISKNKFKSNHHHHHILKNNDSISDNNNHSRKLPADVAFPIKRYKSNSIDNGTSGIIPMKSAHRDNNNMYPTLINTPTSLPQPHPNIITTMNDRPFGNNKPYENHSHEHRSINGNYYSTNDGHFTPPYPNYHTTTNNEDECTPGVAKPPGIRFCLYFLQGQSCTPCHVIHMVMHKYRYHCGIKNCEWDETDNSPPQNESISTQLPPSTEYANYSYHPYYMHYPNNYYPVPYNDFYGRYYHDGYYSDSSKLPH